MPWVTPTVIQIKPILGSQKKSPKDFNLNNLRYNRRKAMHINHEPRSGFNLLFKKPNPQLSGVHFKTKVQK
jgi:hypothetical protein